jgi:hypothetical protein
MRNTINLGLYALAASSIAHAEDSQQTDAHLLKDINAVSGYWGAFSQQNIFEITTDTLPLKASFLPTETMKPTSLAYKTWDFLMAARSNKRIPCNDTPIECLATGPMMDPTANASQRKWRITQSKVLGSQARLLS